MAVYRKNGKYYCRFQIDGIRHNYLCKGCDSLKASRVFENSLKMRVYSEIGINTPKKKKLSKMSLLYALYETYSCQNKRSYKSDRIMLNIVKDYFENPYISDITPCKLEEFKTYLLNDRKVKHSTVNRYKALLSKMFNLGIDNNLTDSNPVKKMKSLREENFKIRFLTKDEEDRLYSSFFYSPPYLRDIVTTALQTGMRKSEILNLKWTDIDFEFGFIEVLQSKSGKSRKIPISDKLELLLRSLPKVCDYVFQIDGKKIGDIKKCWNSAVKRAGITNFRFHDLRHTVATRMVEKGIDLVVVKEILGHADISTTMRYAHAVPERKKSAINVLNNY
jgi:integrase